VLTFDGNSPVGGANNSKFTTPPDGQAGTLSMYRWVVTKPGRHSGLDNEVIAHELMHGITNRMTGGGTGGCLSSLQARALGEGWSDVLAFWTEQTDTTVKDYTLGEFVNGKPIRTLPYSTYRAVNPTSYATMGAGAEPHKVGETWANVLVNVYAGLVGEKGFSPNAHTNPSGEEGNVVFMHLMLDALTIQPCNPDVLMARDAWLQADVNRYKGAHACTLWKAFASRGFGSKAKDFKDDFTIPSGANCA